MKKNQKVNLRKLSLSIAKQMLEHYPDCAGTNIKFVKSQKQEGISKPEYLPPKVRETKGLLPLEVQLTEQHKDCFTVANVKVHVGTVEGTNNTLVKFGDIYVDRYELGLIADENGTLHGKHLRTIKARDAKLNKKLIADLVRGCEY